MNKVKVKTSYQFMKQPVIFLRSISRCSKHYILLAPSSPPPHSTRPSSSLLFLPLKKYFTLRSLKFQYSGLALGQLPLHLPPPSNSIHSLQRTALISLPRLLGKTLSKIVFQAVSNCKHLASVLRPNGDVRRELPVLAGFVHSDMLELLYYNADAAARICV